MLVDTGPLVAIVDDREPDHEACRAVLAATTESAVTTLAALTEAMHLLGSRGGWAAQDALWGVVEAGALEIAPTAAEDLPDLARLMRTYRDHPMDLADATLVVASARLDDRTILTLDGHFRSYRLPGGGHFTVVP